MYYFLIHFNAKLCGNAQLEKQKYLSLQYVARFIQIPVYSGTLDAHKAGEEPDTKEKRAPEETVMRNSIGVALLTMVFYSTSAFAASGSQPAGISWMAKIFFAFIAAIIVFQLIPAVVLLGSMLVSLFSRAREKDLAENGETEESL